MRLSLISVFVIAVVAGIGARWWISGSPAPQPHSEATPAEVAVVDHELEPAGEPADHPQPHADILRRLDAVRSRTHRRDDALEGGIATAAPADVEAARRAADAAASSEELDRSEVRRLIQQRFAEKLPGAKLGDTEYEAMTDAVMRIRAARRALAAVELSAASAEVLASERQALTDALAAFQRASGVAPSDLTDIFDPADGLSHDEPADQESQGGHDADDAGPEYLSDYPPPH